MKNKAFTLIEVFICLTIVGLLSAMIITAVQTVRTNSVIKMVERGERLNPKQREIYAGYQSEQKKFGPAFTKVEREKTVFNGVHYRVIRKEDLKEVIINGQTVYLIED
jgi:prepilin-type N-terminal cleavage/methylation domain-containing protein